MSLNAQSLWIFIKGPHMCGTTNISVRGSFRLTGSVLVNFSPGGSVLSGGERGRPSGSFGCLWSFCCTDNQLSLLPCWSVLEQVTYACAKGCLDPQLLLCGLCYDLWPLTLLLMRGQRKYSGVLSNCSLCSSLVRLCWWRFDTGWGVDGLSVVIW